MAKRTREVVGVQRRYTWRLYPSPEQAQALEEQARMCAALWNALLEMCERRVAVGVQRRGKAVTFHCADCASLSAGGKLVLCPEHKLPSEFDMGYWVSDMLSQCPEWRALSTWTPRRVAGSLAAAWQAFFRRAKEGAGASSGYPRYKSLRHADAVPHRCVSGCRIVKSNRHEASWTVRLKGVPGEIWARGRVPADVHEWMDADVRRVAGKWEVSVAVAVDERRGPPRGGGGPTVVRLGVIDGFATINGVIETPDGLAHALDLDEQRVRMQAAFDRKWPRGVTLTDEQREERAEERAEIARLAARVARVRANALHVWSKRVVERASLLTVHKPAVREATRTPRGDARAWGANVEVVSALNRRVLAFAPAMAAQMLEYKAKEIGIAVQVLEDRTSEIAVGAKLVAAGKAVRASQRAIQQRTRNDERNQQGIGGTRRGDRGGHGPGAGGHEPAGRPQAGQAGV